MTNPTFPWKKWALIISLGVVVAVAGFGYRSMGSPAAAEAEAAPVRAPEASAQEGASVSVAVTVIHPRKGVLERITTQPGTVLAYESVNLFVKVPGFLKTQKVDIGQRVTKGEVLAVVDVPELEKQAERNAAAVDQANAKVDQMDARVESAIADLEAAQAKLKQAEATARSSAAWVKWRAIQHERMKELFALKSIEEKLVDESKERKEAAIEAEEAARAAIGTAKAQITAFGAKIRQARADVKAAQSEVKVAQAELERSQVQVAFATIRAPFDGVITYRGMFPGDFVRAAGEGSHEPLLTVQRTDKMRVVVQVPDRDVPFVDPGDQAAVEIDALPGDPLPASVSRIGHGEDPQTRLMHVEIDLPNPTGKICQGMYGRVTIVLDKGTDLLSIPSSCLVGKTEAGRGKVYVVRDHHAHLTSVRLGTDNGLRVSVLGGLKGEDEVIVHPGSAVSEGATVSGTLWNEAPAKTTSD